ncbi:MAG TPA: tyrosine-protein phosphatase [Pirellulales bacterium]|nr:tyrosine-protein phosphatase [Pirellulales bacterium]
MAAHAPLPVAHSRRRIALAAMGVVMALVAGLGYHFLWRQHVKRFQVVRPGVLYRVAQPSELGIRYLAERHHVKTVLNLRLEDDHLRRGVLAVGAPTGDVESRFVTELGVRSLQWAMGREACWPWVSPWQFEEFFRLFDEPDNFPIAIHCVSGRHRTGTIAALFRLEYDHWPIERVLAEMYSFSFGPPIPLQEINLRTYVPRPQPTPDEWQVIRPCWASCCEGKAPADYPGLVRYLRTSADQDEVGRVLTEQLTQGALFALPLAVRLIDAADHPATEAAIDAARLCLQSLTGAETTETSQGSGRDIAAAASIVADFGPRDDQQLLLGLLRDNKEISPDAFRAVVAGISNRYTGNRIPFLAALLDSTDLTPNTGTVPVRHCDMAVAHLSAIVDERLINVGSTPTLADWDAARERAKSWLSTHPALAQARRVEPPPQPTRLR